MSSSADATKRPRGQAGRAVAPEGTASDSTSGAPAGDQHAPPVALECAGVSKKYGETQAIENLDLTVPESQIVALLGPSGCGKTTALRLIAGFDYPDAGVITIGGVPVFAPGRRTPPEKRRVGMVFQEGALFPHLTVEQNVAYGLSGSADRAERVSEVLDLVGLSNHRQRMPYELSGGQQQRVALARALAPRPEILLLDEPFSNLDPGLRGQVRDDVLTILRSNRITAIFVTHDQEEALYIGDTIVVMSQGRVEQIDSPEAIFHSPASRFVAGFIGAADFIPARVDGGALISEIGSVPWETVQQPADFANGTGILEDPDSLEVMVRPDCLDCHPSDAGQGVISAREFRGAFYLYKVDLPSGHSVRCLLSHTREYPVGASVSVTLRDGHTLKPFWGGRSIEC